MKESSIDRRFGRQAFGVDPGGYHAARPAYPDWVFDVLCERCGLAPNAVTFEIGPGTGTATRRLLELGASPLVAVEPDERLAAFLRQTIPDEALTVVVSTFEEAVLREASFDLGLSATAFHWLNEDLALTKVAKLLRPGGHGQWSGTYSATHSAPILSTKRRRFFSMILRALRRVAVIYRSLSMPSPGWRHWNGPMHSTALSTEPARGRSPRS